MALDWSKEITFSGLRKSAPKRKDTYPTKTHMNLAIADRKTLDSRRVVLFSVLAVVLVVAFAKFGIYDFFSQVAERQAKLVEEQQLIESLEAQLTDYDEVLVEYQSYMSAQLAADADSVSTLEALSLVDRKIKPVATVSALNYSENEIALSLSNITLGAAGDLVSALYEEPIVSHVSVSTAANGEVLVEGSTVAMTITLQKAGDAQ